MIVRRVAYLTFALTALLMVAANDTHELSSVNEAPSGVSKEIAAMVSPKGHRLKGPDGPICDIWLLKELNVQPGFQPTLSVKYPFTSGQLIGVLRVPEGGDFTDFRGQSVDARVYTLRYGKQPEDGNHIGTSDLADFLLAIPAADDKAPAVITGEDSLHQKSAKSAGTAHPAIFSLLPTDEPVKSVALAHDEDRDFWILSLPAAGKASDKQQPVSLRLVLVGESDI